MPKFPRRKPKPYVAERDRLLASLQELDTTTPEYHTVMTRLSELDRILNRTSELKKTIIPVLGTSVGVAGIYGLQQFGGILVPKALEAIAARQEQKKQPTLELD